MHRYALPTALAAALLTSALPPSQAQAKADPTKPANPPKTTPAVKPNAPQTQTPPVAPPKPSDPNIVGSVNGKNIMFADVVARLRTDNPDVFKQLVTQATGVSVADQLFGDKPQASVTITSEQVLASLRDKPNAPLYQVLQIMLREQAVVDAAAKENVVVTDAQVNELITKRIADLRKEGKIPPKTTDDEFLAQQKQSRATLIERWRPQMTIPKLMEKDPVLQKQLQQNLEKTVGHVPAPGDYVRARHILVAVNRDQSANPADAKAAEATAQAKINKIAAEVKSGKKTFEAAAVENSDDPGSKTQGGDLGVFLRGAMLKEFDKAAFAAKPGEIVGPIKSPAGYHLILVEKQGKDLTPEERQNAITLFNQRYEQQNPTLVNTFMQNLIEKKATVITYMTPPPPQQPGFPPGVQGG